GYVRERETSGRLGLEDQLPVDRTALGLDVVPERRRQVAGQGADRLVGRDRARRVSRIPVAEPRAPVLELGEPRIEVIDVALEIVEERLDRVATKLVDARVHALVRIDEARRGLGSFTDEIGDLVEFVVGLYRLAEDRGERHVLLAEEGR